MALSFENPEPGEALASSDGKIRTALVRIKEAVVGLEGAAPSKVTTYPAKVIAAEHTRENTAFGTMSEADEIPGIVVPAGGTVRFSYLALVKASASAGTLGFFLNSSGVPPLNSLEPLIGWTNFRALVTIPGNSSLVTSTTTEVTSLSGFIIGGGAIDAVNIPAGTYNLSVKFKASSGSVTVKERTLKAEVHSYS
jgi:hypothetical protein